MATGLSSTAAPMPAKRSFICTTIYSAVVTWVGRRARRAITRISKTSSEDSMPTIEWRSPANEMAIQQFDIATAKLNLDANVAGRLRQPERAMIVSVPTRMDDTQIHIFTSYRVQHNDMLKPFKKGI